MKPILVALLLGLLLLSSGCIQPKDAPVVTEKAATAEWKADGIVGESEYFRSMVLQGPARQGYSGGEMKISWKNDQEYLYLALNGSTDGWLAIGFEPQEWMKNSDIILSSVQGSKATVLDEYCTGNYGPHIEDTMLGGTNDITEFGGSKGAGRTVIELKRKLDTGDKFDKAFSPGQAISIIWALSQNPDISLKHNVAYGEGIMTLTSGQTITSPATATVATLTSREKEGLLFI
ncbi:MAG: DOMON domain-containing protein [Methanothrix sp.]